MYIFQLNELLILYHGCKFCIGSINLLLKKYEPHRDKTNKMARAPSEDSDQPGHPPSLIRVFAVRSMGS